jgi:hypothetical protein
MIKKNAHRSTRRASKNGGRVQAAGGKFEHGLNLLPRDVELVDDFVYSGSGLKVLEDGGDGHPSIAKDPCATQSSRHAFHGAALGPIDSSHILALLFIIIHELLLNHCDLGFPIPGML